MNSFFGQSDDLDHMALRPLAHIRENWELIWDDETGNYAPESDSFAELLNELMEALDTVTPPAEYHDHEDRLAEYVRDELGWPIEKKGRRWVGADYGHILETGGYADIDELQLTLAAAGRVKAARDRGQLHFDDMEASHQKMLAVVLSVIMF